MLLNKIYDHRFFVLVLVALYLLPAGILAYLFDHLDTFEAAEALKKWVPWNLKVNFFLLAAALVPCVGDLKALARGFINHKGLLLVALFLFTFSMTAFVAPRTHRIYYDEDIYGNVAQNMAIKEIAGFCNYGTFEYEEYYPHWVTYNKEPGGWPFLVSLAFRLLGTDETYAFYMNNILLSVGVLVVFFIARHITGAFFPSFLAGIAYALIPHNLIWSNTAAAEPSAATWAGLTVLTLAIFLKTRLTRHLLLMALVIPLACQMRAESGLIALWSLVALLTLAPGVFAQKRLWVMGLPTLIFLLPHFLHFYAVSGHNWGAEGSTFSMGFLRPNIAVNGLYYLTNRHFPVLFTALALLGLCCSKGLLHWRILLLLWFLFFWGIFLFFYAGSYAYGADVRFALLSFMPLSLLGGLGAGWVRDRLVPVGIGLQGRAKAAHLQMLTQGILLILVSFSFLDFLPQVRRVGQEAWGARCDHKYAQQFIEKIPSRSMVLTQNPTMFLLWGQNAIQTYAGLNNPDIIKHLMKRYDGHVYFHHNYWCNTKSEGNRRLCQGIRDRYHLEEVATAREQDYEYGLYKMRWKD